MTILIYKTECAARWDEFIASTQNNFLLTRRFLSYHGDRFNDQSLLLESDDGELRAVFPAAVSPTDEKSIISHPGVTYGGLIHRPGCRPDEITDMIEAIRLHFRERGFGRLVYRSAPCHIRRPALEVDVHALWRAGAKVIRRDLWNVIDLASERKVSNLRVRGVKKAHKAGVRTTSAGSEAFPEFHAILTENLATRHKAKPTHTLCELETIQKLFPERTELWVARNFAGEMVAGVWVFKIARHCWHTQYIASSDAGREVGALDQLFTALIDTAAAAGVHDLSFGNSTEDSGTVVNSGLFAFKSGFGAGSVVHDFYELAL